MRPDTRAAGSQGGAGFQPEAGNEGRRSPRARAGCRCFARCLTRGCRGGSQGAGDRGAAQGHRRAARHAGDTPCGCCCAAPHPRALQLVYPLSGLLLLEGEQKCVVGTIKGALPWRIIAAIPFCFTVKLAALDALQKTWPALTDVKVVSSIQDAPQQVARLLSLPPVLSPPNPNPTLLPPGFLLLDLPKHRRQPWRSKLLRERAGGSKRCSRRAPHAPPQLPQIIAKISVDLQRYAAPLRCGRASRPLPSASARSCHLSVMRSAARLWRPSRRVLLVSAGCCGASNRRVQVKFGDVLPRVEDVLGLAACEHTPSAADYLGV